MCAACILSPYISCQTTPNISTNPQTPIADVSPTSWDFGPVLVGCTSPQKRVSVKNSGDAQLIMYSISITGLFAIPVNHCGNGVKVGSHCDVYITYSPEALETDTGTLTFTDNAPDSPQTVSLSGHGATIVPTATTENKPSPQAIYVGQTVTVSAHVSSLGGCLIPDGEVIAFGNNSISVCSGTTLGGSVSCQGPIDEVGDGSQNIFAYYVGDAQFYPSYSKKQIVYVSKWPTKTTLASSTNPSKVGQDVLMTATVVASGPYPPTGNVSFIAFNGSKEIKHSYIHLSPTGTAQVGFIFPTAGSWTVYADYGADSKNRSSKASLVQVVNP